MIAQAPDGADEGGGLRVRLNLVPEAFDINRQGVVGDKVPGQVPDLVQDPVPAEDHPGVAAEEEEQAVFQGGQRQVLAVSGGHATGGIHLDGSQAQGSGPAAVTAEYGSDPAHQLPGTEGLGDVIVAAQFQTGDGAALVGQGGEENHRDVVLGLDGGAEGKTAAVSQGYVQKGQVEPAGFQDPGRRRLAGGSGDGKALLG